ncbi:MAG TPA: histidinol-phosphate transaminase [Steroidobacteraceae bacterium]|nr:histidinol-phosphate transaminase [Steroidobacteraceae bacterium]
MSPLCRKAIAALPQYNAGLSVEAVRSRFAVERIAKLGSNENPHGASPAVLAALVEAGGKTAHYPDGNCVALRGALSRMLGVAPERIIVGNGSENLLELACLAVLEPDDRVITQGPCFGLHEIYARAMGARVEKIPVDARLEFDVPAWRRALGRPARLVMIANPSNPVGCRLEAGQFRDVISSAPEDALLLIDEAYYEFARAAGFPDSIGELARQRRPWLVLRTFSKAYGLAGLRVGYGVASCALLVDMLDRLRTPFNVNVMAQAAAVAALGDQAHMAASVREVIAEREVMRRMLAELGYTAAPSSANFLFFDAGEPAQELADRLLRHGVIVKAWREPGYEQYIRVSVGCRADTDQFIGALRRESGRVPRSSPQRLRQD